MIYQKPLPGATLNRSHPLAMGLVGAWMMSEGGGIKLHDSAKSLGLATSNNPTWSSSPHGRSLTFVQASSQYAEANDTPVTNNGFSLVAVAMASSPSVNFHPLCILNSGSNNQFACIYFKSSTSTICASQYTGSSQDAASNDTYLAGMWYLVVGTFASTSLRKVYVDGKLRGISTASNSAAPSGWNRVAIGSLRRYSSIYGSGSVAFASIYNRVLVDSEIAQMARDPCAMFRRDPLIVRAPSTVNRRRRLVCCGSD